MLQFPKHKNSGSLTSILLVLINKKECIPIPHTMVYYNTLNSINPYTHLQLLKTVAISIYIKRFVSESHTGGGGQTTRRNLDNHKIMHSESRPHEGDICDEAVRRKDCIKTQYI